MIVALEKMIKIENRFKSNF